MHKCTSIIINSFDPFQQTLFNKAFVVEGGEGGGWTLKSKWKQTGGGEGLSLSLCSPCEKNCLISQRAKRVLSNKLLGSCWKFCKKGIDVFLNFYFYIWPCKYFHGCYRICNIYLCKKRCHQFFIQKIISISHVKWTGMNKGEQIENLKFWVKIFFKWPQRLFAATKIYILNFNLTHSFISFMGSFHFPQSEIFSPIHWQILNILGNGIPQSFMLSLKFDHPLLCKFPILIPTVKLKLGHMLS